MQSKNETEAKPDQTDLKKRLTDLEYKVTQQAHTEPPFSHKLDKHFEKGSYQCICCFTELFKSDTKFDSMCGWPAFFDGLKDNIQENVDSSHGMRRVEVVCKKCKAHLGHVFNDGPKPTGIRYCINGSSVKFIPA